MRTSILVVSLCFLSNVAHTAVESPVRSAIPEHCIVWFDGCNTCQVGDVDATTGMPALMCTKKYCPPELLEEPKCLEYEDGYTWD